MEFIPAFLWPQIVQMAKVKHYIRMAFSSLARKRIVVHNSPTGQKSLTGSRATPLNF
jgi:hypothetical protein